MSLFQFLKENKIRRFSQNNIEPQDIFLDSLAKKKEEEIGISEKRLETPLSFKISVAMWISLLFLFFSFISISFYLQILNNEEFKILAEKNKFAVLSIRASRGIIYDRNNIQLVFNSPGFNLVFEKDKFPSEKEKQRIIIEEISQITGLSIETMILEIEEKGVLLNNLDHQVIISLKPRIDEFPGFTIEESFLRDYRYEGLLSHIIGYTGKISREELSSRDNYNHLDYIGKAGIERSYESLLRRDPGMFRIERDAKGNHLSQEIVSTPSPGESLVLWIDIELQKKVEEVLKNNLERLGSEKGTVIALDPKTGGVLSMVSIPSYNPNVFNNLEREEIEDVFNNPLNPLFNRAVSGQYSIGSVIKPLMALAALEEGIITPEKEIYAGGKIEIPHRYDPSIVYTFRDIRVHGNTDMKKAIAASVNVYFYAIGGGYKDQKGLGPGNIKRYLELFGWGDKTGIDVAGEKEGFIPSVEWKREVKNENWWDGDTYNLSIGQGDISITPIQVASSYVALANGGILYSPRIVKEIIDKDGNNIVLEPEIIREGFVKKENIRIIQEGMRTTVTGENSPFASAMSLNYLPKKVAAKTGTAQISRKDHYNNWIVVYGPYEDPEIVLLVLIEEVKGVQPATIPVAREILEWYFNH